MKPHEETWEDDYEVTVVGPRLERHEDIPREVLARAAPEMARALRAVLTCQNKGLCRTCEMTIKSALVKAGVPLP